MGDERGKAGWSWKDNKAVIPEANNTTLTKSLCDATHYGRDAPWGLMQKAFREGLKGQLNK